MYKYQYTKLVHMTKLLSIGVCAHSKFNKRKCSLSVLLLWPLLLFMTVTENNFVLGGAKNLWELGAK